MIRLGVIGCGGFGLFAMQHFAQLPGVQPVAMAGTHREASIAAARRFGMPDVQEVEALPRPRRRRPGLHRHAAVSALRAVAGRTPARQARHLREAAGRHGRAGRRD